MSKMVQIRNVPEAIHRRLKARAASAGRSLSDYLLAELTLVAERPSPDEMWQLLQSREPVEMSTPAAEMLRQERDAR